MNTESHSQLAAFIWSVADLLRGDFKQSQYGRIILNGSPLFTGGAGSGESEIRRYLLQHDLVEAIVGLPTDLFTTPASPPMCGFSPTTSPPSAAARCS
ncbi:N-6 DNA methylase [Halomonas sp. HK25]|uniref:N-6 DNA methylase n=1 Tax=Halomonas sp. HK25 TaxID=3394321 RepID=UPI0039FD58FF